MRVLITGITGFCGQHLARLCEQEGATVTGFARRPNAATGLPFRTIATDLTDADSVRRGIAEAQPDAIFHLAAAPPTASPEQTYRVNVLGTVNLLDAAREAGGDPVTVVVSSSAVYGAVPPERLPITEACPFRPVGHYGVSKVTQEMLAIREHLAERRRIVCTRPFNVVGPGQPPTLVWSELVRQIVAIELGRQAPVVQVGNLTPERDFVDVRDVARGHWLAGTRGTPGEVYNICSGQSLSVAATLRLLETLSPAQFVVTVEEQRVRRTEVPIQRGDAHRLTQATGWQPAVSIEQSLRDLLREWRERMQQETA